MSFVFVACKLPTGLHLDVELKDGQKKRATVAGMNSQEIIVSEAISLKDGLKNGGFAVTKVDKDIWDAWIAANAHQTFVKSGHIFAHEKKVEADAKSLDNAENLTGFEPLDATKKPANIKTAEVD